MIHLRRLGLDLPREFLGAAVRAVPEQRGQQEPAGGRDPAASLAQPGEHVLDRRELS